jgi:hypothetical protein
LKLFYYLERKTLINEKFDFKKLERLGYSYTYKQYLSKEKAKKNKQ